MKMLHEMKQDILSDGDEDMFYLLKRRKMALRQMDPKPEPKPKPVTVEKPKPKPRSTSKSRSKSSKKKKKKDKKKKDKKKKDKKSRKSTIEKALQQLEDLTPHNPLLKQEELSAMSENSPSQSNVQTRRQKRFDHIGSQLIEGV